MAELKRRDIVSECQKFQNLITSSVFLYMAHKQKSLATPDIDRYVERMSHICTIANSTTGAKEIFCQNIYILYYINQDYFKCCSVNTLSGFSGHMWLLV